MSALIFLPILEFIDTGYIPYFHFITSWGSMEFGLQTYKEVIFTEQAPFFVGMDSGYLMMIVSIMVFGTALIALRKLSNLRAIQTFSAV